jgi:hypothetical protein
VASGSRGDALSASRRQSLAALGACGLAALLANLRLLRPEFMSADALVHQYWMRQWRDPALFNDPLTRELRHSARYPEGYEAIFRMASQVVDPIAFGELLGVGLMALSGWLIFLIVREHTDWRPAPWLGAALFLALLEIHRFYGGFPRGFVHPVVLLTVLLALRDRQLVAALVAAAGALFYPPAALLAVGVLCVSARDRRRAGYAALALGLAAIAVLAPGAGPRVMTAGEARGCPEFGADGSLHFFAPSVVEYLSQNRSGFDLRTSGSVLFVAAVTLLLARRENWRLLRREVLALPVVALGAWAVAQAVLFKLYLPHRYTYPLLAFLAIVVAVTLEPTWRALAERRGPLRAFVLLASPVAICAFAIYAFPLAPVEPARPLATMALIGVAALVLAAAAVPLSLRSAAAGAAVTGAVLVGLVLVLPDRLPLGNACQARPATSFMSKRLPKDAIIAGDPRDLMCVVATARRPVVISTQLAPAYEADYFRRGRERMFATLRAYYGHSSAAIADLGTRYGADYLWVRRDAVERELDGGGVRWKGGEQPYGHYVRQLLRAGEPAVLNLPVACRRWQLGPAEVYDIGCLAGPFDRSLPRHGPPVLAPGPQAASTRTGSGTAAAQRAATPPAFSPSWAPAPAAS